MENDEIQRAAQKKSSIVITVIAIAALLVAVAGATYAYFASSVYTTNNVPVNVKTSTGTGTFTATSTGDIHFNITSAQMLQSAANNDTPITVASGDVDTATVKANLVAPSGETVTCTYSVVWEWAAGTNTYAGYGTSGANLTNQTYVKTRASGTAIAGNELTLALYDGTTTSGSVLFAETNMDFALTTLAGKTVKVLKSDTITATGTSVVKNYTAKIRFYNRAADQSIQEGKTFAGNIRIINVVC